MSSDMQYTTGINAHYLGPMQFTFATWIINARNSGVQLNGLVIYDMLKRMYPFITESAFRKYFTSNLRGRLVSAGLSNMPEPNAIESIAEPWIRRINQTLLKPGVKEYASDQKMAQNIADNARLTQYNPITSSPFKQRISYKPPPETPEE